MAVAPRQCASECDRKRQTSVGVLFGRSGRQAKHLATVLASEDVPTVIGSDLNSWAGGASEPAVIELLPHFPQTSIPVGQSTFRGGRMLDYMFLRVPPLWASQVRTIDSFFGSDHRPLISWIHLRREEPVVGNSVFVPTSAAGDAALYRSMAVRLVEGTLRINR